MLAVLLSYRKRCAPNSPTGQLILPETLRVLPLYTLCAHKMLAFRPNVKVRDASWSLLMYPSGSVDLDWFVEAAKTRYGFLFSVPRGDA